MIKLLTTQEAADLLGYTRRHIHKLWVAGHITGHRVGVKIILLDYGSVIRYKAQYNKLKRTLPPIDKANRSKP